MDSDALYRNIQYIKGVGPVRQKQLARLGLYTPLDILWHIPRDYLNPESAGGIAVLDGLPQGRISLRGVIRKVVSRRVSRSLEIIKAELDDGSGRINAVWFNQPFVKKQLAEGLEIWVSGTLRTGNYGIEITVTDFEILDEDGQEPQILPLYSLTEGLSQKNLRRITAAVLEECVPLYPELLADEVRMSLGLPAIGQALQTVHFPGKAEGLAAARRRLALEEILVFKLARMEPGSRRPQRITARTDYTRAGLAESLTDRLPFQLTGAQQRVVAEIFADMASSRPMQRLLQGDVGSGKTVVAALAMARAVDDGLQAALMAPTEILAGQHYLNLQAMFAPLGIDIALLSASCAEGEKRDILEGLAQGTLQTVVGTHALIQDRVSFHNLGLVVVDEQHRFGVMQREKLFSKGAEPDVLVMSATPIPRTLSLSIYGDQHTSWLDELPPGRMPIRTRVVGSRRRTAAYDFVAAEIGRGRQAYIICPLVEESEKLDLQNASQLYDKLQSSYPGVVFGLLHGRLPAADKDEAIQGFKAGNIQALVATTVVEVGVDNPAATVIVVEQAERFGLAQLHQLRGRVGRGELQSYCILIAEKASEEARARLAAMERTNDGFELAMEDLRIRGPGDMMGLRQHGLAGFKVLDIVKDGEIIEIGDRTVQMLDSESIYADLARKNYISTLGKQSAVL